MDRHALFVDAGYLIAEGGRLCFGAQSRSEVHCHSPELIDALARHVAGLSSLPLLRVYWYDAWWDGRANADQSAIGLLPRVKLRLGRLTGEGQKGVDTLIVLDLVRLAEERAIAEAYLLSGDEDVREAVVAAQELGVRVTLLGVTPTAGQNQAASLVAEADGNELLSREFLAEFLTPADQADSDGSALNAIDVLNETATRLAATLSETDVQQIREAPAIPPELDRALLTAARQALHRLLTPDERLSLRAALRNALRLRGT